MGKWAWSSGGYDSGTAAEPEEDDDDPFGSFDSGTAAKSSSSSRLRSSVFGSSFDSGSAAKPSKKKKSKKKKSKKKSSSSGIGGWLSNRAKGAKENVARLKSGSGALESYAKENEKIDHYRQQHEQADTNVDRFFNATAVGVDVATDNPYFSLQDTGKEALRSVAAHNSGLDRDEISDEMLASAAEKSWEENVASQAGGALNRVTGTSQQSSVEVGGTEVSRADALEFALGAPTRALSKTTTGMDVQSGDQSALTGDEAIDAIGSVVGGGITRAGVSGAARLTSMGARKGASTLSSAGSRSAADAATAEPLQSGIGSLISRGAREGAEAVSRSRLSDQIGDTVAQYTGRQTDDVAQTTSRSLPEDINLRTDASSSTPTLNASVTPRSETLPDRITDAIPGSTGRQDLDMIRADNGGGIPGRATLDDLPGDVNDLRRMAEEGFDSSRSRFTSALDEVGPSSAHRAGNDAINMSADADGVFRTGGRQVDDAADEAASTAGRQADSGPDTVGPTAREAADTAKNAATRAADSLSDVAGRVTGRNLTRPQALGISALGLGGLGYIASDLFEIGGDVDPQDAADMPDRVELADGYFIQMTQAYPAATGGAQYSVHDPTGQILGYAVVLRVDLEAGNVHILKGSADSSGGPRPTKSRASARALHEAEQRGAQAAQRAQEFAEAGQ